MLSLFFKEVRQFFKINWWIFIIFFISLYLIYRTNSWNLIELSFIFLMHFIWDTCVMMMWDYFANNEPKKALYSQTLGFVIFVLIWLYTGIFDKQWSYLLPQFLFFCAVIKWFFPKIWFMDYKFLLFLWIIVFFVYYLLWLIDNVWMFIQILWFIVFPVALVLKNEKLKYYFSLLWVFFIFIWSAYFLYIWYIHKNITWASLSFTLLPFTTFVFYLKNLKKYIS